MCVPCSANKCRIRESDLQAAYLYIIFLNWYETLGLPTQATLLQHAVSCHFFLHFTIDYFEIGNHSTGIRLLRC